MKLGTIVLSFKTPDAASFKVNEKVREIMADRAELPEGREEDRSDDSETEDFLREEINSILSHFLLYGEILSVEIDLDKKIAKVLHSS